LSDDSMITNGESGRW